MIEIALYFADITGKEADDIADLLLSTLIEAGIEVADHEVRL